MIGIDGAGLDDLLHLRDGDTSSGRHHRIEVPRRAPVDQIAEAVALPCLHEREVGPERLLEHVSLAFDDARFLAFGDDRAVRGRREEARDAGAGGPHPLGKRPLRHQLDFDLAAQELALELLVLADVGGDHLLDLPGAQEQAGAEVVHAGVVADDGEAPGAAVVERANQVFWNAADAEPAHHDGRAIGHERHGGFCARQDLVHVPIILTRTFQIGVVVQAFRPACQGRPGRDVFSKQA